MVLKLAVTLTALGVSLSRRQQTAAPESHEDGSLQSLHVAVAVVFESILDVVAAQRWLVASVEQQAPFLRSSQIEIAACTLGLLQSEAAGPISELLLHAVSGTTERLLRILRTSVAILVAEATFDATKAHEKATVSLQTLIALTQRWIRYLELERQGPVRV